MGNGDERELVDRLREVRDAPVPPARTNLDAVISRGRRRLALQRAGGVLGVVAVVAGISFATLALRGIGGGGGAQIPQAAAPVTTATTSPEQRGQAWSTVSPSPSPGGGCKGVPPMPAMSRLASDERVIAAFAASVRGVAAQGQVARPVIALRDTASGVDVFTEVSDASGVGSVHLSQYPDVADPLAAADKAAHGYIGCAAILRVVRPSGAVLQLRGNPTVSPQQTESPAKPPSQPVWPYLETSPDVAIYLPDARVYDLTQSRYASLASKSPSSIPPSIAPRKTLPLSDWQFQAAAEDFVARLGF